MEENFFNRLKEEFNIELNEQQRQAVININGPNLVLAVPGAGKTTTLLTRTAYMVFKGVNPKNILSITFSNKSAADMKERFNNTFKKVIGQGVQFLTIHSFSNSVVDEYYKSNGWGNKLIENDNSFIKRKLVSDIYKQYNNIKYISGEKLDKLFNYITYAKNSMMTADEIKRHKWSINNFIDVFNEYEKAKRANGYIDYDDMLSECLRILQSNPATLNKYRMKYKYIQVDEAQDTSRVQHEIIKILGAPYNNIFYVADDDQSIYGFRAACPQYLINIKDTFPDITILNMEENFRSSGNIVSVCNQFIKKNNIRYDKNMFTNNVGGIPIRIAALKDSEEQYEDLISNIKDEESLSNTAILFRTKMSLILLVDRLHDVGIKFKTKETNNSFFNHPIVVDMINYMKFAENNKDIALFEKIYWKSRGNCISKSMVEKIKRNHSDRTVFDKLINLPNIANYHIEKILDLKRHFETLSRLEPRKAIDYIETNLNSSSQFNDNTEHQKLIMNTLKTISLSMKTVSELIDKLNNLAHCMKASADSKDSNAVTLSTVHSSKGLEWDNVFMVDLLEGIFPAHNSDLEEERRLFYVGMTRAKKKLTLYRYNTYNNEEVNCSIFLEELYKIIESKPGKESNKAKTYDKKLNHLINVKESKIIKLSNKIEPVNCGEKKKKHDELLNLNIETVVEHKKWGKGIVVSINEEKVKIDFEGVGSKILQLSFCNNNHLLKIVS